MIYLFCFLAFFDDGKSVLRVEAEDISAGFIPSAAYHLDEAIFLTCKATRDAPVPQLGIWHVDTKTMALSKLNDARFPNLISQVLWAGNSFVLLGPIFDKVIKLTNDLKFGEQISVNEFLGTSEPLPGVATYYSPYLNGKNLVTFSSSDQAVLGIFDGHHLDLVASFQSKSGMNPVWLYIDHQVLLIEPELGKVSQTDSKFMPSTVIVKGHALIPRSSDPNLSGLFASRGLSPYFKTFTSIITSNASFTCNVLNYIDLEGSIRKKPTKEIGVFGVKGRLKNNTNELVIVSNKDNRLTFNLDEGIVEIKKN